VLVATPDGNRVVLRDAQGRVDSRLSAGEVVPVELFAVSDQPHLVAVASDAAAWLKLGSSHERELVYLKLPAGCRVLAVHSKAGGLHVLASDEDRTQLLRYDERGRARGRDVLMDGPLQSGALLRLDPNGFVGLDGGGSLVVTGNVGPLAPALAALQDETWDFLDAATGSAQRRVLTLIRRMGDQADMVVLRAGMARRVTLGRPADRVYAVRAVDQKSELTLVADAAGSALRVWRADDLDIVD
jgi:hypothetical protein